MSSLSFPQWQPACGQTANIANARLADFVAQIMYIHFQGVGRGFVVPVIEYRYKEGISVHRTACLEHQP